MKSSSGNKKEILTYLNNCLEKLVLKDDGNNTLDIKYLYAVLDRLIADIESLPAQEVLSYYRKSIDEDLRKHLRRFNIDPLK